MGGSKYSNSWSRLIRRQPIARTRNRQENDEKERRGGRGVARRNEEEEPQVNLIIIRGQKWTIDGRWDPSRRSEITYLQGTEDSRPESV